MTSEKVRSSALPTSANIQPTAWDRCSRRLMWAARAVAGLSSFVESTVAGGINWWACPDITITECAYLTVPRDYSNPQPSDTVSIFMRKIPATVGPKEYLGSILFNPGGPGGSGSASVARWGPSLSTIVDGRYDIIGFDPRGVNMTIPPLNCFTESQSLHSLYKELQLGIPYGARGPKSLPAAIRAASERAFVAKLNASQAATAAACLTHGSKDMLASVSTALVAQDMERIAEALGEDGLNFWGFSYGTILGSTFAAMRPHLVKRMVLDGVSNAESYHNDILQWGRGGLTDSHKTLSGFFDSCASAGPDRCAFAKSTNGKASTSAELRSRLEGLYERLRETPMPVPQSSVGPGVLTASDAKLVMVSGLYSPKEWPKLALAIAAAESGNAKIIYEAIYGPLFTSLHPEEPNKNIFNRYMVKIQMEGIFSSIACGDSAPLNGKSLDDYIEYFHELTEIGPIGENMAILFGLCQNWKIRPIQRYEGPWSVEAGLKKTRFPILYASLDADLVTPLSSAVKMSEAFGNQSAVLLVQEGFGHGTMKHPSLCTAKIMRDYFVNGKVPAACTRCKPEPGYLFPGDEVESVAAHSAEDSKLLEALDRFSDLAPDLHYPI